MTNINQSPYTDAQMTAWMRGLLTLAWADGHFDPEEQDVIIKLTQNELAPCTNLDSLETITPEELALVLGKNTKVGENFLRTAVLVAIADGIFSPPEAKLLQKFNDALGLDVKALKSLEHTLCEVDKNQLKKLESNTSLAGLKSPHPHPDLLHPVKDWLEGIEVHDPRLARFLCKMIPAQCPFERDVTLFGHKIIHIPPMCKINPLYDQLMTLRFRSLSYLADDCKEDISEYI
jgi:tellurite resistance protein